jgi:hypothetical protein
VWQGPPSRTALRHPLSWSGLSLHSQIKTLHKKMLGDVWTWAGSYRKTERNIGVDAYRIPAGMAAMLAECPSLCSGAHMILNAAVETRLNTERPGKTASCRGIVFHPPGERHVARIPDRHSRERACEKIEIASFGKTPQRHSRESGNPFLNVEQALRWMPAFARMTLRPGFLSSHQYFHTLESGNPWLQKTPVLHVFAMGHRFREDDAAARISAVWPIFSDAPLREAKELRI